jgi:site-specific recombinase XerC
MTAPRTNRSLIPNPQQTHLADLPDHTVASVGAYVAQAQSPNTHRAYRAQIRHWMIWCQKNGITPLPANPAHVAAWLADRASSGHAQATLAVARAAIKALHVSHDLTFDADDALLRQVWAGICRAHPKAPTQAAPLTGALLRAALAHLQDDLRDRRDAALLSTIYTFALRRSEAAAIDLASRGSGSAVLRTTRLHAELLLIGSKTRPTIADRVIVARETSPLTLSAIEHWIEAAQIAPGTPLLRRLSPTGTVLPHRLSADGINRAVKAAMTRVFVRMGHLPVASKALGDRFTGHSGRIGFVVSAKDAGADDSDVMATTRHRSPEMIATYSRQADQLRRAAHRKRDVGV